MSGSDEKADWSNLEAFRLACEDLGIPEAPPRDYRGRGAFIVLYAPQLRPSRAPSPGAMFGSPSPPSGEPPADRASERPPE
jgi:hypothetical protein